MPRLILGLDPGSRFTGYGIIESRGSSLIHITSGRVVAGSGPLIDRLEVIFSELQALIEEHSPSEAAIEGIFHHRNADSALKLGHARGVALLACRLAKLNVAEYQPSVVKQAVTGRGNADKMQVQQMVRIMLSLQHAKLDLDTSDALGVAICHAHRNTALTR